MRFPVAFVTQIRQAGLPGSVFFTFDMNTVPNLLQDHGLSLTEYKVMESLIYGSLPYKLIATRERPVCNSKPSSITMKEGVSSLLEKKLIQVINSKAIFDIRKHLKCSGIALMMQQLPRRRTIDFTAEGADLYLNVDDKVARMKGYPGRHNYARKQMCDLPSPSLQHLYFMIITGCLFCGTNSSCVRRFLQDDLSDHVGWYQSSYRDQLIKPQSLRLTHGAIFRVPKWCACWWEHFDTGYAVRVYLEVDPADQAKFMIE